MANFYQDMGGKKQHFTLNGKEYLLSLRTTKWIGKNLVTTIECSRRIPETVEGFVHSPNIDFSMRVESDYSARITQKQIKSHLENVEMRLPEIMAQAQKHYS